MLYKWMLDPNPPLPDPPIVIEPNDPASNGVFAQWNFTLRDADTSTDYTPHIWNSVVEPGQYYPNGHPHLVHALAPDLATDIAVCNFQGETLTSPKITVMTNGTPYANGLANALTYTGNTVTLDATGFYSNPEARQGGYTIEFWARFKDSYESQTPAQTPFYASPGVSISAVANASLMKFGGTTASLSVPTPSLGTWFHVASTFEPIKYDFTKTNSQRWAPIYHLHFDGTYQGSVYNGAFNYMGNNTDISLNGQFIPGSPATYYAGFKSLEIANLTIFDHSRYTESSFTPNFPGTNGAGPRSIRTYTQPGFAYAFKKTAATATHGSNLGPETWYTGASGLISAKSFYTIGSPNFSIRSGDTLTSLQCTANNTVFMPGDWDIGTNWNNEMMASPAGFERTLEWWFFEPASKPTNTVYATFPYVSSSDTTGANTMSGWGMQLIHHNANISYSCDDGGGYGVQTGTITSDNKLKLLMRDPFATGNSAIMQGGFQVTTPNLPVAGSWNHIAVAQRNDRSFQLFLNGVGGPVTPGFVSGSYRSDMFFMGQGIAFSPARQPPTSNASGDPAWYPANTFHGLADTRIREFKYNRTCLYSANFTPIPPTF